jgi:metal-dependent amidase/aminoacylase/carboxypeptidase family protein
VKNINLKELNLNESKNYEDLLIKNRRDLHKIPELGFQEFKTSKYIYEQIKDFVDEIYNLATTGIVAYIHANPKNKKTLLLRADIDALPIKEENEIDYKSTHEGVMHACGHDAHSSILINTIKYFSKTKIN